MSKEIVLPYHLYQRIKASAGEHGGIGRGELFSGACFGSGGQFERGMPVCAHGHAWGTCVRFNEAVRHSEVADPEAPLAYEEPELRRYLSFEANDAALQLAGHLGRVSFDRWCELLNVKCGPKPAEVEAPELVAVS